MIRQDFFLASKALYAIDLAGLVRTDCGTVRDSGAPLYNYRIPAVWFKRRRSLNTANVGHLWDISTDCYEGGDEADAVLFLTSTLTDGRYGGVCRARWDGERLWSDPAVKYKQQLQDAAYLRTMLTNHPRIPFGFDGWWRF